MKKNSKAFTLVELVISITVFSIIFISAFSVFPYVMSSIKKISNQSLIINESTSLKEELNFSDKSIGFYSFLSLSNGINTKYDFENIFRNNLRDIIENSINELYPGSNYQISNPNVCVLPYQDDQIFSSSDLVLLEDEFKLISCNNDINHTNFDSNYRILVVVDEQNLSVNIYFPYLSKLHKISTSLITDLSNDDVIFHRYNSGYITSKVYNNFEINKFSGRTQNLCSPGTGSNEECIFTDFNEKSTKSGDLFIDLYTMTRYVDEIHVSSSYQLNSIYTLNK